MAASSRRLHRRSLRVRAENNNNNNNNNSNNPLDALRDVVASRPVAQKAVLRLLLSPGLTGTLAVAGCYLAKMSSPLSALLAPPTAADVAVGLAAAVPLVALDALLLGPFYQPEAPRRQVLPTTTSPSPSPSSSSAAAEISSPSGGEGEKEKEGGGGGTAAEEGGEADKSPKRPDPAVVEAGRLALLRSLSASGVAVFDAGALASGSSSSVTSGGEKGEDSLFILFRRRLRSAAHAYASRAVRSTLAREIPGNPVAEAALVVAARAGTELLARSFALRLAGGWVADRVVEGGGLAGEDALVSLLAAARAPPDAPLGTAGELLVLAATAAGLVGIGVAGVVAAEAEAARSAAEVERRSRRSRSRESSSSSNSSSTEEASTDGAGPASTSTSSSAATATTTTTTTAEALERGSLAVMRQISRARADAALLDASLDAARLLVVGGAFVASGDHVAASLLATVVRELPFRRWLVKRSAARAERVRREARAEFEKLVEGDEKFLALRRAMEERREKRALWLKRQEELRSGVGGGLGGGGDRRRRDDDDERGEGKDEL